MQSRTEKVFDYLYSQVESGKLTEREISRETGIPRSTLYAVKKDIQNLPVKYNTILENYYQRFNYTELREAGLSREKSQIFRKYSPDSVTEISTTVRDTVNLLTAQGLQKELNRLELLNQPYNIFELEQLVKSWILENIEKSQKNPWEYKNYRLLEKAAA